MFANEPFTAPPTSGLPLQQAADLQDHLLTASHDLDRLQRLLGDAGDALLAHFHGADSQLRRVQELLAHEPAQPPAEAMRQALAHVAGAITALQFQDMASQLIAHTKQRLRGCADRIASEALGADDEGEAVVAELPERPNPVTQDEMDAGSIELF